MQGWRFRVRVAGVVGVAGVAGVAGVNVIWDDF